MTYCVSTMAGEAVRRTDAHKARELRAILEQLTVMPETGTDNHWTEMVVVYMNLSAPVKWMRP